MLLINSCTSHEISVHLFTSRFIHFSGNPDALSCKVALHDPCLSSVSKNAGLDALAMSMLLFLIAVFFPTQHFKPKAFT